MVLVLGQNPAQLGREPDKLDHVNIDILQSQSSKEVLFLFDVFNVVNE